jgi:hypothetical protein
MIQPININTGVKNKELKTMTRVRILIGLGAMLGLLAVTAAPASATFRNHLTKQILLAQLKIVGTSVLEGGGGTVECEPKALKHIEIDVAKPYKLLAPKWLQQRYTQTGPDLIIQFESTANGCRAKSSSIKNVEATVHQCWIHIQQRKYFTLGKEAESKEGTELAKGVGSELGATTYPGEKEAEQETYKQANCEVTASLCTIVIPFGKATTEKEPGLNYGLKETEFKTVGGILTSKIASEGVTSEPSGFCPGIEATKTGKLKTQTEGTEKEALTLE